MDNYYKIFKEDAGEEDLGEEDKETLSREMKDLLGEGDELDRMLLATSAEAFRHLGGSPDTGSRDSVFTQDITDQDDEDEEYEDNGYLAYKFLGRELFRSESTDANEGDEAKSPRLVGDSQGHRTTRFEDFIFHA